MRNEVNETIQFCWGRVFCSIGAEDLQRRQLGQTTQMEGNHHKEMT
jgi:hypothetical protein